MKKLVEGGDYFSDETMKHRDPLLYEQMVGQYLTEDEVAASIDKSDLTFSSILMSHIQMQYDNVLYNRQRDIEEGQMEESEDDDSDLDEDFGVAGRKPQTTEKEDLSEAERLMLRDEFLETMKLRFINGEDRDFNYSDVDNSVEYDPLDIRGHDEEEKYFDEDDTESTEPEPPCADVQMQD
ncbi:hypothetical protein NP493_734g02081 [Ridgeia piscesae]|uniref:CCD97-like C-terminal domain-containing protein n=1 Tax=Ridgeia piscesae TaxID=27915 RepID=A0AAD9KQ36_RIDPI|nr:hypothetical protein NP493_734g02081 [Ridgeia piscesae]